VLDEQTPTAADVCKAGGYAMAKLWQETLARRLEKEIDVKLTVLRPGFIWGRGHEDLACLGQRFGKRYVVFGGLRGLALTHVDNCADCFGVALDHPDSVGHTFNVVDDDSVTAWNYTGHLLHRGDKPGSRVFMPSWLARLTVWCVNLGSELIFGERGKLPSIFVPCRYRLRFLPMRFSNQKLRDVIGWAAPQDYTTCLERTYGAPNDEAVTTLEGAAA
jgi:UDP-glucose 4-epimerase